MTGGLLLGLQSRFGDNWGQITWSLSALSPKQDRSSKGVSHNPKACGGRGQSCFEKLRFRILGRWHFSAGYIFRFLFCWNQFSGEVRSPSSAEKKRNGAPLLQRGKSREQKKKASEGVCVVLSLSCQCGKRNGGSNDLHAEQIRQDGYIRLRQPVPTTQGCSIKSTNTAYVHAPFPIVILKN